MRWRFFQEALPDLGWEVSVVSGPPRPAPAAGRSNGEPGRDRLAAAQARAKDVVREAITPAFQRCGVQPEVLRQNILWSVTGRPAIRRAVRDRRPDVVLATSPSAATMIAGAAAMRRSPIPFVVELRDLWARNPHYDAGGRLLPGIQRRVFAAADSVVCVTSEARDRLLALHPEIEGKLHVLPNGFDPSLLALRDSPLARLNGRATLIHAGALYGGRSIQALLDALERPRLKGRIRLDLLGSLDWENEEALRRRATDLELRVLPPTNWEDAIRHTREADIAVVIFTPGDDTAVPGKLYEALALGKPVLALTGEDSATRRLLHRLGRGAGCARHDDPESIAAALDRLLERPPEPLPVERIAEWDRAVTARSLAAMLDGLASRPPRASRRHHRATVAPRRFGPSPSRPGSRPPRS